MTRRTLVLLLAALTGLVGIAMFFWLRSSPPASPHVLRIPDTRFMGLLPLYVADEQGYFADQGLTIEWIDVKDPGQASLLFFAGRADLLMSTFANLLPAEVRQPGTIRLLYPNYESSSAPGSFVLVRHDSPLRSIDDLRGHSLGTYSGPSQRAYAILVLESAGLRESEDVRLVQVASAAQVQGLFGGSYDALFTVEPYASVAIANGARILEAGVRTKYISDPFWVGAAAVPSQLTINNPDVVKGILSALDRASKYIDDHDAQARAILERRTSVSKDVASRCALYTPVAHPTGAQLSEIQQHVDLLVDAELLSAALDVRELFEGSQ